MRRSGGRSPAETDPGSALSGRGRRYIRRAAAGGGGRSVAELHIDFRRPGTGKTSIVVRILGLLQQQAGGALDIALTAPTGKAATRLQAAIRQAKLTLPLSRDLLSAIPEQATTIHRLLGSRPDSAQFRYHAGNPLPVDALVMDEASMVDVALMARLLQALPAQCRLILLGDRHQLASVEAGSVLSDIYGRASGFTPAFCRQLERVTGTGVEPSPEPGMALSDCIVTLRHSYRFDRQSGIRTTGRCGECRGWGRDAAATAQRTACRYCSAGAA